MNDQQNQNEAAFGGSALTAMLGKPSWKPSTLGEVLVDLDGKIIGEVYKAIGTGYNAISRGDTIGIYYTETQAKRAVEYAPNAKIQGPERREGPAGMEG